MSSSLTATPPRNPVVCGALGRYDRAVVERIARALGVPLTEAHRDRFSLVLADREPLRWRRGLTRGVCWSEGLASSARGVGSWEQAATEIDAFGLAVSPRARLLHTSVSGVAPLYWRDHGGATYFAPSVDVLARAIPGTLHTDWDAWGSIFTMRLPLAQRTPFKEIRRLPPYATLRHEERGRVRRPAWPWAEIDPHGDPREGGHAVYDELVASLEPLRDTGATVTLSAGHDSRLILCAALEAGVPTRAITMSPDDGSGYEAELAARIAEAAGVEHEVVPLPDPERFLELWQERLIGCDFQFIINTWLMPLAERLREYGTPVLDGYTLDVWAASGKRFYTPEMLAREAGRAEMVELWHQLRGTMGNGHRRAFGRELAGEFQRRCRRAYMRDSRSLFDCPNRALLIHYTTRTVRGVSSVSVQTLGRYAHVLTPAAWHRVSRVALAIEPSRKHGGSVYDAMMERGGPAAQQPGIWSRDERPRRQFEQLRFSEPMVRHYERWLADGPLTPWLRGPLGERLAQGELAQVIQRPSMHRAAQIVTAFHIWADRYSDRLATPDPGELLVRPAEAERAEVAEATPG